MSMRKSWPILAAPMGLILLAVTARQESDPPRRKRVADPPPKPRVAGLEGRSPEIHRILLRCAQFGLDPYSRCAAALWVDVDRLDLADLQTFLGLGVDPTEEMRRAVLTALGRTKEWKSYVLTFLVRRHCAERTPGVRTRIVDTIVRIGGTQARGILRDLAPDDEYARAALTAWRE